MGFYFTKIPDIVQQCIPQITWKGPVDESGKSIYLTFDDGPNDRSTNSILDLLEELDIPATFFVTGQEAEKRRNLMKAIYQSGHAIANHGYQHRNALVQPMQSFKKDVDTGRDITKSNIYRPPFGSVGPRKLKWLQQQYKVVMWSIMPGDFEKSVDPVKIKRRILKYAENGTIVVLHDRPDCIVKFLPVLPDVVQQLKMKGFVFKTLSF